MIFTQCSSPCPNIMMRKMKAESKRRQSTLPVMVLMYQNTLSLIRWVISVPPIHCCCLFHCCCVIYSWWHRAAGLSTQAWLPIAAELSAYYTSMLSANSPILLSVLMAAHAVELFTRGCWGLQDAAELFTCDCSVLLSCLLMASQCCWVVYSSLPSAAELFTRGSPLLLSCLLMVDECHWIVYSWLSSAAELSTLGFPMLLSCLLLDAQWCWAACYSFQYIFWCCSVMQTMASLLYSCLQVAFSAAYCLFLNAAKYSSSYCTCSVAAVFTGSFLDVMFWHHKSPQWRVKLVLCVHEVTCSNPGCDIWFTNVFFFKLWGPFSLDPHQCYEICEILTEKRLQYVSRLEHL